MSLKRAKDDYSGWWFYCPTCGHKAYESDRSYFLCANTCGYFDKQNAIINSDNPMKNVRKVKVVVE